MNNVIVIVLNNIKRFNFVNLFYIFMYTCLIFFICVILELGRQKIFRFVYKRKFSIWLRKKYQSYFTSFDLEVI